MGSSFSTAVVSHANLSQTFSQSDKPTSSQQQVPLKEDKNMQKTSRIRSVLYDERSKGSLKGSKI